MIADMAPSQYLLPEVRTYNASMSMFPAPGKLFLVC